MINSDNNTHRAHDTSRYDHDNYSEYLKHNELDIERAHGITNKQNIDGANARAFVEISTKARSWQSDSNQRQTRSQYHRQHIENTPLNTRTNKTIPHHQKHNHYHEMLAKAKANSKALLISLFITSIFAAIEYLGGCVAHSVALKSDALHMLTDSLGLLVAYVAAQISKKPASTTMTFGYGNAEAVGALISGTFTFMLTFVLLFEALQHLLVSNHVNSLQVILVASLGLLSNIVIAGMLAKHTHSINAKAAFIHVIGDLLISVVTILAGLIVYFTQFHLADPILSLVIIGLLFFSNYKLMKQATMVLMAGVPDNIEYKQIGRDLEAVTGVIKVHDLHVWYMSAHEVALSAHVIVNDLYNWHEVLKSAQKLLYKKYAIGHVTLQHETHPEYLGINYCEAQ